jgi:hypothetical protein
MGIELITPHHALSGTQTLQFSEINLEHRSACVTVMGILVTIDGTYLLGAIVVHHMEKIEQDCSSLMGDLVPWSPVVDLMCHHHQMFLRALRRCG